MENEQKIWTKTLLNCYSYLETICGAIDKKVINYGIGSYGANQTISVANKILSLISRKKFLINTKLIVDNVLNNISNKSARILTVRYIDKVKTETASKVLNMSNRNFFRRLNLSVDEFATELKKQGYDSKVLFEIFGGEGWIMEIYNSYSKKNIKNDYENINLLSIALNSIKSKRTAYESCWKIGDFCCTFDGNCVLFDLSFFGFVWNSKQQNNGNARYGCDDY